MAGVRIGRRSAGKPGSTRSAGAPRAAVAGCRVRSGGGALRRGLEAAARRACRLPQSARHLQSRRRRRCADGGPLTARRAAGARGRLRPHRADDRICRAACADAPPAGALLAANPSAKGAGRRKCNGRRARSRSASWGWARLAPTRPTRSSASAFASQAGAAARGRIDGIDCFHGEAQIEPFLRRTDILVSLLPLTPETRHILNRALFEKLNRSSPLGAPVLINAGRGGLAERSRHPAMPRRRHARRRLARRLRRRAAAGGQSSSGPTQRWC